jgi:hypothetical protein
MPNLTRLCDLQEKSLERKMSQFLECSTIHDDITKLNNKPIVQVDTKNLETLLRISTDHILGSLSKNQAVSQKQGKK